MMTEKDIKPCPFCGAETRTFVPNTEYAVKDKAIEAWNRRTDINGRSGEK